MHPGSDFRYISIVGRLDAATELTRQVLPCRPPDLLLAAELVRATGMAVAKLTELHTALGQQYAATLPASAADAWRDAVRHLRAASNHLQAVPEALRQSRFT